MFKKNIIIIFTFLCYMISANLNSNTLRLLNDAKGYDIQLYINKWSVKKQLYKSKGSLLAYQDSIDLKLKNPIIRSNGTIDRLKIKYFAKPEGAMLKINPDMIPVIDLTKAYQNPIQNGISLITFKMDPKAKEISYSTTYLTSDAQNVPIYTQPQILPIYLENK